MKILMISEKDAANFSLTKIADAFIRQGHQVEIYATHMGGNALRMFDKSILITSLDELNEEKILEFDCIFASAYVSYPFKRMGLLQVRKYIFTYDYLIHGELVNRMDFGFSPSVNNTTSPHRQRLRYPLVGVGEPRFDSLSFGDQGKSNQILFIDSGHYPFGEHGKRELSRTLLLMARQYPEYLFVVKPRFLPTDEIYTHKNSLHLYNVLEAECHNHLPENLVLLKEHQSMEKLIDQSRTVVCMYTTAYITALAAGKGLIILDGLPNEDNCDLRVKRLNQTRTGMLGTKALIDYQEAIHYLPDGIVCEPKHLHHEITCLDHVSEKIVAIVSQVMQHQAHRNEFPLAKDYRHGEALHFSRELDWDDIIKLRLKNSIKYFVLTKFDYHVNADLDIPDLESMVNDLIDNTLLGNREYRLLDQKIKEIQDRLLIENEEKLMKDEVDQGLLLKAHYDSGLFEKISSFPNKKLGSYAYFAGKTAVEKMDFDRGITLLKDYLTISIPRPFKKEITDDRLFHMSAYAALGEAYGFLGDKENSLRCYEHFLETSKAESKQLSKTKETLYREQAYRRFYGKWQEVMNNKRIPILEKRLSSEKLMIYGAGSITESLLIHLKETRKNCVVLVDRFCAQTQKHGIPVIHPDDLVRYPELKTIIIAVPHLYNEIIRDLERVRPDLRMIKVEDYLDEQAEL